MKRLLVPILLVFAASLVPAAPAAKGGTITGTVVVAQDGKAVPAAADVYVYLEEATPSRHPGEGMSAKITQRGIDFEPHVVIVPSYARVFFPNKDNQEHSVFSPPDPPRIDTIDLGHYGKSDPGKSHQFLEPHEYKIYCDIHMGMWAYVKVVPSRYIVKVVKGKFEITGLPPGKYKAVAWAPQALDVKSEWVTIAGDETQPTTELHLQTKPRPVTHLRLDGSAYPPGGKDPY
jgi:plastocyanin